MYIDKKPTFKSGLYETGECEMKEFTTEEKVANILLKICAFMNAIRAFLSAYMHLSKKILSVKGVATIHK